MPTETYALRFHLVDPNKLAQTVSPSAASVLIISGLVEGSFISLSGTPQQMARSVNRNILRLVHSAKDRQSLEYTTTEVGTAHCFYCAQCGRKFESNTSCKMCKVSFVVTSGIGTVIGKLPGLPPKVAAYAKKLGHEFIVPPPRL